MKVVRLVLLSLTLSIAAMTSAYAHDSFSFGINIGGPGYYAPPPVRYYPAPPPAVYYAPPPVYYRSAPPVYYQPAPRAYYRYYDEGPRRHHDHDGWGRRGW